MKSNLHRLLLPALAITCIALLFTGCKKDTSNSKQTKTYTIYTPVYKSKATVLAGINGNASQAIEHAGKIYIKDNFIYLNDVNKGIHIIDNSNPLHPVQIAFLSIPGNLDIAIKGNILYADMYTELLALDITNPRQARITSTITDFFIGRSYVYGHSPFNNDQVAAEWSERDTTVLVEESPQNNCDFCVFDLATGVPVKSSATGTAGSMAGMVLMNDHLYAITEMHSVGIIDISNAAMPVLNTTFFAGFDLQTIFPFDDKLFLGSAVGMFMYDVSNPANPVAAGEFQHGRACDPVITDGSYAYVTLHAGDGCGGDANELHVIDVRNLPASSLVKTYPLTKPTGLSKDGNLLFVCDGTAVKIYNATDPAALQLLQQLTINEPYDIITGDHKAMVVCANGLYQYDYTDINHIRSLSFLPAKK
ncbi:MAG: hypothetical protein IPP72_10985 [Chitinophagaceae bacterium]|nr:hypothetical protein [Chitinophagaceae bacterium]